MHKFNTPGIVKGGIWVVRSTSDENIRKALQAARALTILADEGEAESDDDGCMVLFSVVRDCAYRIRAEAQRERNVHESMGKWKEADDHREQQDDGIRFADE